jgi:DNA (cytosine-5)-methyltransferase 1
MIKVATAFSGGLAACEFGLKYEEIEHEVIFACEWDQYARKQYLKFHGEPKTFYNDITDLDAKKYNGQIDLFVWGSPCQDLSLAGKRAGFDGAKSSFFREGARVQKEMMPKKFIFENVRGLLTSNGGNDYKEVVQTFQEMGYLIAHKVVNAKEHGTAQNRERVFVVGFLDEDEYHSFHFAEPIPLKKRLRDYLEEDEVDEKYYLSDKMLAGFIEHKERHQSRGNGFKFETKEPGSIANCINNVSKSRQTDNYINEIIQVGNIDQKGHNSLWGRVFSPDGIGTNLNANGGGAGAKTGLYKVRSNTKSGYEIATENDSIGFGHMTSNTRRGRVGTECGQTVECVCKQGIIKEEDDRLRIRRLTPRECFRLMGVRDEDIQLVNSDTQNYKIAGNGIEVNTIRALLFQLFKAEKRADTLF